MKIIPQSTLEDAVLFKIFVHSQESDVRLKKDTTATLFGFAISPKRTELALDTLVDQDLLDKWTSGANSYSITRKGYAKVEKELVNSDSFFRRYYESGDAWLENMTLGQDGIPAADRVVTRQHNEKALVEIHQGLEQVSQILSTDNAIGAELGDERILIDAEIKAADTLVEQPSFRLSRLIMLLMPALRFLSEKFATGAIGELAKRLMSLLLGLI